MEQLIDPKVIAVGLLLVAPAKSFADFAKSNVEEYDPWFPPVAAFAFAFIVLLAVGFSSGANPNGKFLADTVLASGYAAAGALFTTEYHNSVRARAAKKKAVRAKEQPE